MIDDVDDVDDVDNIDVVDETDGIVKYSIKVINDIEDV